MADPPPFSVSAETVTFSSLPTELRHKIWNLALSPRTLTILVSKWPISPEFISHNSDPNPLPAPEHHRYTAVPGIQKTLGHSPTTYMGTQYLSSSSLLARSKPPHPGPPALYVCWESRSIALCRYTLSFAGTALPGSSVSRTSNHKDGRFDPKIWIDFTQDTVYFPPGTFTLASLCTYSPFEAAKITTLQISAKIPQIFKRTLQNFRDIPNCLMLAQENCPSLKTLILYHFAENTQRGEDYVYVRMNEIEFSRLREDDWVVSKGLVRTRVVEWEGSKGVIRLHIREPVEF
ncbi:hypothetical protein G7Y89_g7429 [Cudoniella acicularis]|uniref:2EXR domain-containing protein n=1 Tax=Cudoniella acicularis TaxID=354080 RepID=A0A8H4RIK6_9HELO|nr:hypothetical protein G7Y89_g7429 [Cudoniella acicularis]